MSCFRTERGGKGRLQQLQNHPSSPTLDEHGTHADGAPRRLLNTSPGAGFPVYNTLPHGLDRQESPETNKVLYKKEAHFSLKLNTLLLHDPDIPLHLSKRNEHTRPSDDVLTNGRVIHSPEPEAAPMPSKGEPASPCVPQRGTLGSNIKGRASDTHDDLGRSQTSGTNSCARVRHKRIHKAPS